MNQKLINEIDARNIVYSTGTQYSFFKVHKDIAMQVGIEAALLLSDLIGKHGWFIQNKDASKDDHWFFNTVKNIQLDTGLNEKKQHKCLQKLVEMNFIEIEYKGLPKRRFFKILYINILEYLSDKDKYLEKSTKFSASKMAALDQKKERLFTLRNGGYCTENSEALYKENKLKRINKEKKEKNENKKNVSPNVETSLSFFDNKMPGIENTLEDQKIDSSSLTSNLALNNFSNNKNPVLSGGFPEKKRKSKTTIATTTLTAKRRHEVNYGICRKNRRQENGRPYQKIHDSIS